MCEEKCTNDANCSECAGTEQSKQLNNVKFSFERSGKEHKFELATCSLDPHNYERDVCDTCCEKGIGQYFFDKKRGVCNFAHCCSMDSLMGSDDNVYLKEIKEI
jgi:hypothetical protein